MKNLSISEDEAYLFHLELWLYVHGIATMIATNYLEWDIEFIDKALTDAYQGLRNRYSARSTNNEGVVVGTFFRRFDCCLHCRRKSTFNYIDLSTVCHTYITQEEKSDFVLYYFSNQYAWNFFPEQSREKIKGKLIKMAAAFIADTVSILKSQKNL